MHGRQDEPVFLTLYSVDLDTEYKYVVWTQSRLTKPMARRRKRQHVSPLPAVIEICSYIARPERSSPPASRYRRRANMAPERPRRGARPSSPSRILQSERCMRIDSEDSIYFTLTNNFTSFRESIGSPPRL